MESDTRPFPLAWELRRLATSLDHLADGDNAKSLDYEVHDWGVSLSRDLDTLPAQEAAETIDDPLRSDVLVVLEQLNEYLWSAVWSAQCAIGRSKATRPESGPRGIPQSRRPLRSAFA